MTAVLVVWRGAAPAAVLAATVVYAATLAVTFRRRGSWAWWSPLPEAP
jgi:hypothetical protein